MIRHDLQPLGAHGHEPDESVRKPTRIERLAPEITTIAAEMGDTVCYYGGDYFLRNAQRSLWNSRRHGALTKSDAELAARALRRLADATAPDRAKPLLDRAMAVVAMLRPVQWRPGYGAEVTTEALDRGYLSRSFGEYSLGVTVAGEHVHVGHIVDRDAAFDALVAAVRAKWSAT